MINPTREQRKVIRERAGASDRYHITVVPGMQPPIMVGESYHYVTPAGHAVRYPSAYRRAFCRPIYVPSSRQLIVGDLWLALQPTGLV